MVLKEELFKAHCVAKSNFPMKNALHFNVHSKHHFRKEIVSYQHISF